MTRDKLLSKFQNYLVLNHVFQNLKWGRSLKHLRGHFVILPNMVEYLLS